MAEFEIAYHKTNGHEGGYVFDPDDRGGETYGGISRRWHPGWMGWRLIDQTKRNYPGSYKDEINSDPRLLKMKRAFYKVNYWNPLRLSEINNQEIANQIYDMSINSGISNGVKLAERVARLPETGRMSTNLINALNHVA